jgi:hypothetical protein
MPRSKNTPSWRGSQLKHRDIFTFTFVPVQGFQTANGVPIFSDGELDSAFQTPSTTLFGF